MHSSTKIPDRRPRVRTRFIVHPDGTITPEFVSVARVAAGTPGCWASRPVWWGRCGDERAERNRDARTQGEASEKPDSSLGSGELGTLRRNGHEVWSKAPKLSASSSAKTGRSWQPEWYSAMESWTRPWT